jgi:hypothetical protein
VDTPRKPGEPPKSFVEATERPTPLHGATDGPKQREAFIRDGLLTPKEIVESRAPEAVFVTMRHHDDECWERIVKAQREQVKRPPCLPACRVGQPIATCKLLGHEDWRRNARPEWERTGQ